MHSMNHSRPAPSIKNAKLLMDGLIYSPAGQDCGDIGSCVLTLAGPRAILSRLIFIGPMWSEAILLSFALDFESATKHRKSPTLSA